MKAKKQTKNTGEQGKRLRFKSSVRNFHAILALLGRSFEGSSAFTMYQDSTAQENAESREAQKTLNTASSEVRIEYTRNSALNLLKIH